METWTYEQITDAAEICIRSLMTEAQNSADPIERELKKKWAFGAFLMWSAITVSHRNEGDYKKMSSLTYAD